MEKIVKRRRRSLEAEGVGREVRSSEFFVEMRILLVRCLTCKPFQELPSSWISPKIITIALWMKSNVLYAAIYTAHIMACVIGVIAWHLLTSTHTRQLLAQMCSISSSLTWSQLLSMIALMKLSVVTAMFPVVGILT